MSSPGQSSRGSPTPMSSPYHLTSAPLPPSLGRVGEVRLTQCHGQYAVGSESQGGALELRGLLPHRQHWWLPSGWVGALSSEPTQPSEAYDAERPALQPRTLTFFIQPKLAPGHHLEAAGAGKAEDDAERPALQPRTLTFFIQPKLAPGQHWRLYDG